MSEDEEKETFRQRRCHHMLHQMSLRRKVKSSHNKKDDETYVTRNRYNIDS